MLSLHASATATASDTAGAATPRQPGPRSAQHLTRRRLGVGLLAGLAAAAAQPAREAAAADLTPYERGFQLEYGLTSDGRMRSCPVSWLVLSPRWGAGASHCEFGCLSVVPAAECCVHRPVD